MATKYTWGEGIYPAFGQEIFHTLVQFMVRFHLTMFPPIHRENISIKKERTHNCKSYGQEIFHILVKFMVCFHLTMFSPICREDISSKKKRTHNCISYGLEKIPYLGKIYGMFSSDFVFSNTS